MELVGITWISAKLLLDLGQRVGVDQLTQLFLAEQLTQQVTIERERLSPPLGGRRVVLVHVRGDVVEQQRRGERRRRRRLHLDEIELACLQSLEDALQRRQVEDVLQALAIGLEHDRERAVLPRDLKQVLRLQPLLPERCPLAGTPARDQERAGGVLAEAGAEERGLPHFADHELLDLVRPDQQVGEVRRRIRLREVEGDPVVRPDRLGFEPEGIAETRGQRHPPRRMHAAAERRQDADAPVADLVAEALDDDRAIGRDNAGRGRLLSEEGEQVLRRARVEVVVLPQVGERVLVGAGRRAHARRGRSSRPARTACRFPRPSRTARLREPPARARRARGPG